MRPANLSRTCRLRVPDLGLEAASLHCTERVSCRSEVAGDDSRDFEPRAAPSHSTSLTPVVAGAAVADGGGGIVISSRSDSPIRRSRRACDDDFAPLPAASGAAAALGLPPVAMLDALESSPWPAPLPSLVVLAGAGAGTGGVGRAQTGDRRMSAIQGTCPLAPGSPVVVVVLARSCSTVVADGSTASGWQASRSGEAATSTPRMP